MEIWCGCSLGNVRIIDVRTAQLSVQLSHHLLSASSSVYILCMSRDAPSQYSIWTAMRTGLRFFLSLKINFRSFYFRIGSFVCVWNHLSRQMVHQLNCQDILKRSTNIIFDSLTVESILPTRQLVFIGTNSGHIIIIKSTSIQILHTIYAYDQHVLQLFSLSSSAFQPSKTNNESHDGRFVVQFRQLQERFEQYHLQKTPLRATTDHSNENELDNLSYILAIGCGAKACRSIPQLQHYSSDSIFLQAWSLDDFLL